ncbi:glycosyltransferase family 1 protein [Actinoplanes friuliensis]|uniref:Permease n=1 Tax=Actinoplanes friuliensis DSM 7358 TaxID=1246995 RepID=U5W4S3_9ACTN|nr:glycosyltransferase family 1 protein [Actinoplanes friuliensis]AGZ42936.1 permease [Actinoplanes friuliensis DSM 7358]
MSGLPALAVTATERHGVTVAARDLATAVEATTGLRLRMAADDLFGDRPPARAHLHFTDRLWAGSPEEAAATVERIAARTALTVTLHDVPQASDGPRNLPRRTDCYARIARVARGVVVNSRHEAAHLAEAGIAPHALGVVPLPVTPAPPGPRPSAGTPDVAVLGFFYPGKGHAEVVEAVATLSDRPCVTVLGGASAGHEADLSSLTEQASAQGVEVNVTGYVPDDELIARCRSVAVPVVAHRHFSASGSLATWIAAGRRPLVADGRYAREMAALRPETVHLVAPGQVAPAIADALADPASTWLAADAVTRPHLDDTAASYLRWWTEDVAW